MPIRVCYYWRCCCWKIQQWLCIPRGGNVWFQLLQPEIDSQNFEGAQTEKDATNMDSTGNNTQLCLSPVARVMRSAMFHARISSLGWRLNVELVSTYWRVLTGTISAWYVAIDDGSRVSQQRSNKHFLARYPWENTTSFWAAKCGHFLVGQKYTRINTVVGLIIVVVVLLLLFKGHQQVYIHQTSRVCQHVNNPAQSGWNTKRHASNLLFM